MDILGSHQSLLLQGIELDQEPGYKNIPGI
jgi:hypothetical protein